MILAASLAWTIALHMPDGQTMWFATTPELCLAAEQNPGTVEMPDGSVLIPEIAVCHPPDPCICEPEKEDASS